MAIKKKRRKTNLTFLTFVLNEVLEEKIFDDEVHYSLALLFTRLK